MFICFFVEVVEWVAAGDDAVAWCGGAVAECSADAFGLYFSSSDDVRGHVPVGEDHASEADAIDPVLADDGLCDVWEIFLEVGVCGADHWEVGYGGF